MSSEILNPIRRAVRLALRPANPMSALDAHVAVLERDTQGVATMATTAMAAEPRGPQADRLAQIADPRQRFAEAMQANGVTEADLPQLEHSAERRFVIRFLIAVTCVAYAILAPSFGLIGHTALPALDHSLPWIFAVPMLLRAARSSFDLHVIRSRSLSINEWLRSPAAWLGARAIAIPLALIVAAALAPHAVAQTTIASSTPGSAVAQTIQQWTSWTTQATHANDLSLQWLQRMFSGAAFAWGGTSSDTDALEPLFMLVNSILLAFGSFSLAWFTVIGLVHTAHSGKVLGDRWHTFFAPLRVCLGATMLAPVKGYCGAQLIALIMIIGSYGVTNDLWALYVQTMLSPTSAATLVPPQLDLANNLASEVLQAETCAQVATLYDSQMSKVSNGTSSWIIGLFKSGASPTNPGGKAYALPPTSGTPSGSGTVWDYGPLCGSLTLDSFVTSASAIANTAETAANVNDPASSQEEIAAYAAFDQARTSAMTSFVTSVRASGLPQALADAVSPGAPAAPPSNAGSLLSGVLTAAAAYQSTMTTDVKMMAAALDTSGRANFAATAQKLGWASAGALNFTLTRLSAAAVDQAAGAMPAVQSVQMDLLTRDSRARMNSALQGLALLIRDSNETAYTTRGDVQVREDFQSWNPLALLLKVPGDMIARGVTNLASLDPVNPMGDIVGLGNTTLVAGETLFVTYVGLRVAAATGEEGAKAIPIAGPLVSAVPAGALEGLKAVSTFVDAVVGSLLVFGAINAYVLPLIPYIMWFFAVLASATLAAELVVVAPIAAFFHLRYDGQELIDGPQKAIYTIIFHAVTRPPLLLFGLILSNILFAVMAGYLNQTFALAMLSSQGNDIIGIVGIMTMLAILLYMHYQLAVRCMSLVHQIPSMAAHIMGAPDLERGEHGETHNVFAAVGSFVRNTGTSFAARSMTRGPSNEKGGQQAPTGGDEGGTKRPTEQPEP
ncbi:DotA/TraY family protein [Acidisphaera sp. S103]|uniref:DotA/TraY family protein n=1 Tax=Acidisphaera sp. S103 TaxID=1747223 RepID=UPI00131DCA9D|nr:DotA/TraY family protein [Acidisphaera sp. S103]